MVSTFVGLSAKRAMSVYLEINKAFSVLGDPEKRRQYDQFGTAGNVGNIFGSPFARTTFEDLMKDFGGSGLGKPISRLSADLMISHLFQCQHQG